MAGHVVLYEDGMYNIYRIVHTHKQPCDNEISFTMKQPIAALKMMHKLLCPVATKRLYSLMKQKFEKMGREDLINRIKDLILEDNFDPEIEPIGCGICKICRDKNDTKRFTK